MKIKMIATALLCALAGAVFAEVKITDLTNKAKVIKFETNGKRVDRFTVKTVPEKLEGLQMVVVPRGSYNKAGTGFSFKVDSPVTVYLLVDGRCAKKVKLDGWKKTEMKTSWLYNKREYKDAIFTKDFPAGKITIPANPKHNIPHSAVVTDKK